LNRHKNEKTKEILKTTYFDSHVIMLQETASSFVDDLRSDKQISAKYLVISPNGASSTQRDQNSLILLGKPELNQTLNLN
jgi:uroporphyrinogen-III synthase